MSGRELGFSFSSTPGFALSMRLTPDIKLALQNARESNQKISFRLSETQNGQNKSGTSQNGAVLTVGTQEFILGSTKDGNAEIIQMPPHGSSSPCCCLSVASLVQKLTPPLRGLTLDGDLKSRMRALEAEAQIKQKQRQAVILDAGHVQSELLGVCPQNTGIKAWCSSRCASHFNRAN